MISIISAHYGSLQYFNACLNSVVRQTYRDFEWIIVYDGNEVDSTYKSIKQKISFDNRISLYSTGKNQGAGFARNLGIEISTGDYITFIDTDDYWSMDRLEKHLNFMQENKVLFSYTSYTITDINGNRMKDYIVSNKPITYTDLLKRTDISCLTAMYDSRLLGKIYMGETRRRQDYTLWLDILEYHCEFAVPYSIVTGYYRQTKSVNKLRLKFILDHFLFLRVRGLSRLESVIYTILYGMNGIKKYFS